jgi:hypothetical protein
MNNSQMSQHSAAQGGKPKRESFFKIFSSSSSSNGNKDQKRSFHKQQSSSDMAFQNTLNKELTINNINEYQLQSRHSFQTVKGPADDNSLMQEGTAVVHSNYQPARVYEDSY